MRYLKGQAWLTLKEATGIIDHGVKTRISVEQRVKALVSKKNRKSPPLEIARKCQISKSTVAYEYVTHAGSVSQTLLSPKRYQTKYLNVFSSHWESFPLSCLRNDIV